MAKHWQLKPEVSWVQLLMTAGLFISQTRLECKMESGRGEGGLFVETFLEQVWGCLRVYTT